MTEPTSHSVRRHLRIAIDEYDQQIRRFIPGYEEMLETAASVFTKVESSGSSASGSAERESSGLGDELILDLGAGTGALAETILGCTSETIVELLDVDEEMLDQARARLARFGPRARFTCGSFLAPLPRCRGAAASLSLHHISTMEAKQAFYRAVFHALEPGGVFVNADATMPADPAGGKAVWQAWADHLVSHGISEERAWGHFRDWAEEDTYFPLEDELAAVGSAGFEAECTWQEVGIAVLVGRKQA